MYLSESLRQQYLKSMGVQCWFDPALNVPAERNTEAGENILQSQSVSSQISENITSQVDKPTAETESKNINNDAESLASLTAKISQCELCELHINRQQAISGEGSVKAKIFIIIDAPLNDVADENALFTAADKSLLQSMLQAIGSELSAVYITSLVKCMPAQQRAPQTSEMVCCDDHLTAQLKLIQPDVIFILGERASQQLLVSQKTLTDLRLRHHQHLGIPVYASYHPHELFNCSQTKRKVWADLLQIRKHLK